MADAYCPRRDAVARADCDAFLVCVHAQQAIRLHRAEPQLDLFGNSLLQEAEAVFLEWDGIRAAIWDEKNRLGMVPELRA